MITVVERLRSRSSYLKGSSAESVMDEAAAEIERLQAVEKLWLNEVDRLARGWATPANRIDEN